MAKPQDPALLALASQAVAFLEERGLHADFVAKAKATLERQSLPRFEDDEEDGPPPELVNQFMAGIREVHDKLARGEAVEVVEVTRTETPDGPLHTQEKRLVTAADLASPAQAGPDLVTAAVITIVKMLPPGWEIFVRIKRGAAGIGLCDPREAVVAFDPGKSLLTGLLNALLHACTVAEEEKQA